MRNAVFRPLLLCCLLACASPAFGASQADDGTGPAAAESLARDALNWVRKGEDAADNKIRLDAYRHGLDLARRAVAADDSNADAHFALFATQGRILLIEGAARNPMNLSKVNKELDRTLALNPDHADALAAKGGLYRNLPWLLGRDLGKAESCLTRAIELNPQAVGARIELAQTYRDLGHPERGVELLEAAARIAEAEGRQQRLTQARELLAEFRARP